MNQTSVCFDTETTGLNPLTAELVGISFSWETGKGFYLPFPEDKTEAQALIEQVRPFFESESIEKIGQNLKYDIKVLAKYNIEVRGKLFDTMLAHYLINPDMRHNMDLLAEAYLGYKPVSIESLIGKKGKSQKTMRDIPQEEIVDYACEDADITLQLKNQYEPKMNETLCQHLVKIPEKYQIGGEFRKGKPSCGFSGPRGPAKRWGSTRAFVPVKCPCRVQT